MPSRIWLGSTVLAYFMTGLCFFATCVVSAFRQDTQVTPGRWHGPRRRSTLTLAVIVSILFTTFWPLFLVYAWISSFIENRRRT